MRRCGAVQMMMVGGDFVCTEPEGHADDHCDSRHPHSWPRETHMSDAQTPQLSGVRYLPPPPHLIGPISAAVDAYASALKPGQSGGVVGIVTTVGINGAIIHELDGKGTIVGWVAKSWGEPDLEAGLAWKLRW